MRRLPLLTVLLALALAAPAQADLKPPRARRGAPGAPPPAAGIAGAPPGGAADAIAPRHGARRIGTGSYVLPRGRARELSSALGSLLFYAEPNRRAKTLQVPSPDPLDARAAWRAAIVDPSLVPPPVTAASPLLALVDATADVDHPEFQGAHLQSIGGFPVSNAHGTETAAVAGAPKNNRGILGVWPGLREVNVSLPDEIACANSVAGIQRAIEQGASVINMSYGATSPCFAEYVQLQVATAKGITLVAASGNELAEGNPLLFPASLPHVITVAAVGSDRKAAYFSSASAAVDLSAPGVGILTATPPQFDGDGTRDGYEAVTGTSFSAPMVAAAAAWLRAAKPGYRPDQVAQALRYSATDLQAKGWDSATGYGMLNLLRALSAPAPALDPHEPNDDMAWVNGRATGHVDSPIWRRGGPHRVRAMVDKYEDPADVYRIVFPPHARVRVTLKPRFGNPDLAAFTRSATSTADDEQIIGRSRRKAKKRDTLTLRNPSRRKRSAYLVVYVDQKTRTLDSRYELRVQRAKH